MSHWVESVIASKRSLAVIFVVLGALLVILAIGAVTFNLGGVASQRLDRTGRVTATVVGIVFIFLGVRLERAQHRAPTGDQSASRARSFLQRRTDLSRTQEALLHFIHSRTLSPSHRVSQHEIVTHFALSEAEAYYRLECLRLLGFLEKENHGGIGRNYYRLSELLTQELGSTRPEESQPAGDFAKEDDRS